MQNTFFKDGGRGRHLGFLIGTILVIFVLQVALILPTKFWSNGISVQEKNQIKMILATFDL